MHLSVRVLPCVCVWVILCPQLLESLPQDPLTTYDDLYEMGMEAYRLQNWAKCVSMLQSSIDDYHYFKAGVVKCRLKCKDVETSQSGSLDNDQLSFFENLLKESNCLRRCKKKTFGRRPDMAVPSSTDAKFEKRTIYNYLQYCHFRNDEVKKAAAAAYTYFLTHQDDQRMVDNLQYYRQLPELTTDDFMDLERKPFQTAYVDGLTFYNEGEWQKSVESFQKSLRLYYEAEKQCLAECEDWYSHSGHPDFINAFADHFVVVLICQRRCPEKLRLFGMETIENFVADHYNYLQFSYYHVKDYDRAARAVATYLLFHPSDTEMLDNKAYYMKTLKFHEGHFVPDEVAVKYVRYWEKAAKLLEFVRANYTLPRDELTEEEEDEIATDTEEEGKKEKSKEGGDEVGHYMERFARAGVRLFAEEVELGGRLRFAADAFYRTDQCTALTDLVATKPADKAGIRKLSIPEVMELVESDDDYEISLRLLLRAIEISRIYTSAYFNKTALFVSKAELVCREIGDKWEKQPGTLQEDGTSREDLSRQDGSEDEFISVGYLTDIFDGTGHIYFMDGEKNMQSSLLPKCGRVVGFSTSTVHGVNLSWKEPRCVLYVMTTADQEKDDRSLREAGQLLTDRVKERTLESVNNTDMLNEFKRQGVDITLNGEALKGRERFAADGLATEAECKELIELAQAGARKGDGYYGDVTPLTEREEFKGLDVPRSLKRGALRGDGYGADNEEDSGRGSKFVSPYTKFEKFAGLNVSRAVKLVEGGLVQEHAVDLYLDLSEQGRLLVETYLNLTQPLYFDFTHLVCRTAVEGEFDREEDLSHPVHADNCMIQDDGSCISDVRAFMQRHYSAIMYLNDDFDGGEFFFANKDKSEQVSLKPKCGRLVAFNAGDFHGVKAVEKGQRCAVAMWYTLDPDHQEVARIHAKHVLAKMADSFKSGEPTDIEGLELPKGPDKDDDGTLGSGEASLDDLARVSKLAKEPSNEFHDEL